MLKDLSPRTAQTIYQVGVIATSAATIAAVWRGVDPALAASSVGNVINVVLGMLGVGATVTGRVRVAAQRADGTLDFSGSAADQALAAIQAVNAQAAGAVTDRDRVADALGGLAGSIPVVGPLAQQVIDSVTRRL